VSDDLSDWLISSRPQDVVEVLRRCEIAAARCPSPRSTTGSLFCGLRRHIVSERRIVSRIDEAFTVELGVA